MAIYRQVYITFWQDPFIMDLTPEEKFFYLYLMTNSKTKQCGCYELPKRVMEFETGYNRETIDKLLERFVGYKKIIYDEKTSEILLINWLKYNPINNINIEKCVNKELADLKSADLIGVLEGLIRGLHTPTKKEEQEQEQTEEEEQEQEQIPFSEIIEHLNKKSGKSYKATTRVTKDAIKARWNEGHRLTDFKAVIDKKCAKWANDEKMEGYLRPQTLFGTKFEAYLNEKGGALIEQPEEPGKYEEFYN